MKHFCILCATLIVATVSALAWAENAAVGKWNCTSVDERGTPITWTLIVKNEGSKLTASIADLPDGSGVDALEPKLEGNILTFKIPVNPEETVDVTLTIGGQSLTGNFSGKSSGKGTIKGTKQA
jgi:hypothetical protein